MAPPITDSFVSDGPNRWKIPETGRVVLWDDQAGLYRMWDPSTRTKFRWVHTRDDTMRWESYGKRPKQIDFWCCTLGGAVFFGICVASGFAVLGLMVLVLCMSWGLLLSWMHTNHPTAYDLTTVAAGAWTVWSIHDRYKHR